MNLKIHPACPLSERVSTLAAEICLSLTEGTSFPVTTRLALPCNALIDLVLLDARHLEKRIYEKEIQGQTLMALG